MIRVDTIQITNNTINVYDNSTHHFSIVQPHVIKRERMLHSVKLNGHFFHGITKIEIKNVTNLTTVRLVTNQNILLHTFNIYENDKDFVLDFIEFDGCIKIKSRKDKYNYRHEYSVFETNYLELAYCVYYDLRLEFDDGDVFLHVLRLNEEFFHMLFAGPVSNVFNKLYLPNVGMFDDWLDIQEPRFKDIREKRRSDLLSNIMNYVHVNEIGIKKEICSYL